MKFPPLPQPICKKIVFTHQNRSSYIAYPGLLKLAMASCECNVDELAKSMEKPLL